jgi:hypothetical protein
MSDAGVPHLNQETIGKLGDDLVAHAKGIREGAGGVDREVPAVPFDSFNLKGRIRKLDEERQAFDERLAKLIDRAADRVYNQVLTSGEADTIDGDGG